MKTENETPQPQAQQVQTQVQTPVQHTPTPAPTPIPYAAQWGTAHIPIDPSLQQQTHATTAPYSHYQSYTSHYAQAAYAHYHQYTPHPVTQTQPQQPIMARQNTTTPAIASAPANNTQSSSNNAIDTADIATLNDALGSAGVDLRAEEETLQKSYEQHQTYRPYEDRSRKQPLNPSIDSRFLGATMRTIGTQHKVTKVPEESVNYLALALRARLQDLITSMIAASHHRTDTQFDRPASLYDDNTPMWSILVRGDVAKQLAALEKAEREEEMKVRRERKERADMAAAHAANLAAQAAGGNGNAMAVDANGEDGDGGGAKKKRKKEGPGVTARNMSEDVRKKMSNAVASQAAGLGGKYAWMNAANAAAASTPKPKPAPGTSATTTAPSAASAAATSWARPYVSAKKSTTATTPTEEDTRTVVTLRDAMFVIEKERGHGGGRGAARGWV